MLEINIIPEKLSDYICESCHKNIYQYEEVIVRRKCCPFWNKKERSWVLENTSNKISVFCLSCLGKDEADV